MKIVRFLTDSGQILHGRYRDDEPEWADVIEGEILQDFKVTPKKAKIVQFLPPIWPSNILALGLNYRKHADETKMEIPEFPVLFVKTTNSLIGHEAPILLPAAGPDQVDYDGELAVVIARSAKNITPEEAFDHILGYTCANDVSARDWQNEWGGSQWCRGKTFDTFAPLGPCLVTRDEIKDPAGLGSRTYLNGEIMQNSNTEDLIFSVPKLIAFLSGSTTLPDGAVILTGTPSGVGMARKPPVWLKAGDRVEIEIDRIGRQRALIVHHRDRNIVGRRLERRRGEGALSIQDFDQRRFRGKVRRCRLGALSVENRNEHVIRRALARRSGERAEIVYNLCERGFGCQPGG